MKSELITLGPVPQESRYPYLGKFTTENKNIEREFIVLFIHPKNGIVVWIHPNCRSHKIGTLIDTWVESTFERCTDQVLLQND